MSFVSTEMSPADIRACTCGNDGYNNGGMFGNDWAWIVILLLFGWGGRGFGGGFGGQGYGGNGGCGCSPCATQADLAAGFNNSAVLSNLNDLALGQAGIQQTLCQGFNGVNTTVLQGFNGVDNAICTLGYNVQGGFNTLGHQISDCCCQTQRAIDGVNYNLATQGCETRTAILLPKTHVLHSLKISFLRANRTHLSAQQLTLLRQHLFADLVQTVPHPLMWYSPLHL